MFAAEPIMQQMSEERFDQELDEILLGELALFLTDGTGEPDWLPALRDTLREKYAEQIQERWNALSEKEHDDE
jgi:hypothetical protein